MKCISFDIGIYNLAYCLLEFDANDLRRPIQERASYIHIKDWDIICLKDKDKKLEFSELADNLTNALHEQFSDYVDTIDMVFIENQPVQKNPTMKSVQMMVYSYFLNMRHLHNVNNMEIKFVSASNKLKVHHGKQVQLQTTANGMKNIYQQNKKQSIAIAQYYLSPSLMQDTENAEKLAKAKKKDDLADSFLQGVYMIEISVK